MNKIKKEPSTAATAESPMEKIEIEDVNSSDNHYNTKFWVCQDEYDKLYAGAFEIAGNRD